MSELEYTYERVDLGGDAIRITQGCMASIVETEGELFDGNKHRVYLPSEEVELHALTEAIHGRKIAAIVYEDELPPVTANEFGGIDVGRRGVTYPSDYPVSVARENALDDLALALHLEARDAAAKEAEAGVEEAATEWRIWLRTHTDASDVASAARVLAASGAQAPETA